MLEIPPVVQNKARLVGAESWLNELPALVTSLELEWSIVVGRAYDDATEAFVTEASLVEGTPAVVKLAVPGDDGAAYKEITALRLAGGQGCVTLLRGDPERGALLLERLGRSLFQLGLPIHQRHEVLCRAAEAMWRPAPDCGLPTGADKARWLIDFIQASWEELDRPCSERAVEHATWCAQQRMRAHDDERAVLVHGDIHQWNALEASDGFKLVDPDGLLAEAEYDLGVLMREDPIELMIGGPRSRARWLARRTGLDAETIWEWGVVERVSTGLLCTKVDLQPVGREMLCAADEIAAERHP